jgi:hypothetical protein
MVYVFLILFTILWSVDSACKFNTEIGIIHQNSHLMQFAAGRFFRVLWFPPVIHWQPRYNWNIVESGAKHHKPPSMGCALMLTLNRSMNCISCFWLVKSLIIKSNWYSVVLLQYILGIPETNLRGRNTLTARSVLRSIDELDVVGYMVINLEK